MVKLRYSTLDFQSSVEFNCPQKKKKKKPTTTTTL